jgi:hypothetical protein
LLAVSRQTVQKVIEMKKLTLAAAALACSASLAPAAAIAQTGSAPMPTTFPNRGQCQSALVHIRNMTREQLQGMFRPNEVNEAIRGNVRCEQRGDTYVIVVSTPAS